MLNHERLPLCKAVQAGVKLLEALKDVRADRIRTKSRLVPVGANGVRYLLAVVVLVLNPADEYDPRARHSGSMLLLDGPKVTLGPPRKRPQIPSGLAQFAERPSTGDDAVPRTDLHAKSAEFRRADRRDRDQTSLSRRSTRR